MKYYILTGERSGDLHASNLIKALRMQDKEAQVRGTGGDYLAGAGVELFKRYEEMAFMGLMEVLRNLRTISKIMKACQADILKYKPDVLILVDFGGFNMRMAKFAKSHGIKTYYYISPKIWAWNQKRALKIKASVDRMFVIMPFEKDFYKKFDYHTVDYVGNPVQDAVAAFSPKDEFRANHGLQHKRIIAILAGSRKQEVSVMLQSMLDLVKSFPDHHFVVAGVSNLPSELYEMCKGERLSLVIDETYDLLSVAEAAVVTSGTATLETALFNVPQVVCYRTHPITYSIGKRLVKISHFSLPNIIAGKEIIRELIQHDFNQVKVREELSFLLPGGKKREGILQGYNQLKEILGPPGASQTAAQLIWNYLKSDRGN